MSYPPAEPPHAVQYVYVRDNRRFSAAAVVSLIFSLLWLFGLGSLVGILSGHQGINECKRGEAKGDGVAVAGTILGYVGLIPTVVFIVVIFATGAAGASSDPYSGYDFEPTDLPGANYSQTESGPMGRCFKHYDTGVVDCS